MNEPLRFAGSVMIQAQADGGKPPRISILAYSGGIMNVAGYGDIVIDLVGLTLPGRVTLLADHISTLDKVAGSGTPSVVTGRLVVEGTLASNETGKQIVSLSHDNVPLQASVGIEWSEKTTIKAKESLHINGQTLIAGPKGLTVVKAGVLREVSILPLGADDSTSVQIAAKKGLPPMADEPNAAVDQDESSEVLAERNRVGSIYAAAKRYGGTPARDAKIQAIAAQAVASGLDARDAELSMVRLRADTPGILWRGGTDAGAVEVLSACRLVRGGHEKIAVSTFGPEATEQARRMRASSFVDICAGFLRAEGRDPSGLSRNELIRASFSTLSLPTALGNLTGRALLPAYREATGAWRGFCAVKPAADFKQQTGIRPSFVGQLVKLPPDGEIKHGTMSESVFPWKVDTYAKMFSVDRQDIINDDLGFLSEAPYLMGRAAARAVNDLIWGTIIANANGFFSLVNKNLLNPNPLDSMGLGAAIALMRTQRNAQGDDIAIVPTILAVPPEMEQTARSWIESELLGTATGPTQLPSGNPFRALLEVVSESRLSNAGKFPNASAKAWYIFGSPYDVPIIVGFLDGIEVPTVETLGMSAVPNQLALTFRCWFDFGCATGDMKAAVKSIAP
jgi:Mu-like prophage major head subunit gpT